MLAAWGKLPPNDGAKGLQRLSLFHGRHSGFLVFEVFFRRRFPAAPLEQSDSISDRYSKIRRFVFSKNGKIYANNPTGRSEHGGARTTFGSARVIGDSPAVNIRDVALRG